MIQNDTKLKDLILSEEGITPNFNPDIYKYEDILYSNNALLLNMLCSVLRDKKLIEEKENSIASVTFILESYIEYAIKKTFGKDINSSITPLSEE